MFPLRQERSTLRDLAAPLCRHPGAWLAGFCFIFLFAALAGQLLYHTYRAHMVLRVSPGEAAGPAPEPTERSAAQALTSRDLLQQVVLANGLENADGSWLKAALFRHGEADPIAAAVGQLGKQIEVETAAGSNLIEVRYHAADPGQAYGVLSSLANLYARQQRAERLADAEPRSPYQSALLDAQTGLRAVSETKGAAGPPLAGSSARTSKTGGLVLDEADVDREAKAAEEEFLRYLATRERERSAAAAVSMVIPPTIPTAPVHSEGFILLTALACGMAAGVLTAYLFDSLDPHFHSPQQVSEQLGILVVAAVPKRTA